MPLIDLAEAVSRGDIIVDEVDALNKYAEERLLGLHDTHSQRLPDFPLPLVLANRNTSGNSLNEEELNRNTIFVDEVDLVRAANEGLVGPAGGSRSTGRNAREESYRQRESSWERVLVDEVDFIHAAEQGEISRDDSHICNLLYEGSSPENEDGDVGLGENDPEESLSAEEGEPSDDVMPLFA